MGSGDDSKKREVRIGFYVGTNMGAPFDMVCPQVALEVGRHLGTVEAVEQRSKQDMQCLFMQVKIAIPFAKPLRRGQGLLKRPCK